MVLVYVIYVIYMTFNARINTAVEAAMQRRREARQSTQRAAAAVKYPHPIVHSVQPPEMNDSALVGSPIGTKMGPHISNRPFMNRFKTIV